MAFALPLWLAVQKELLEQDQSDPTCFDQFDDGALFLVFHLTRPCIAFITDALRIGLKKNVSDKPELPADVMAMVALNYYAHGVSSPHLLHRVGQSQTDWPNIISTVSEVLAGMCDAFISFPLFHNARISVASRIEKFCGIPNALGVLAPAHFRIRASPYEKDTFRSFLNTLGYTSVVSQLICDSDGNILSVEKCCVGSTYEEDMWDSSIKGKEIEDGLHGQFWVIGGKGYNISEHVLTPVSEPANDKEIHFNKAHTKIQKVMRKTLGSMKRRFRCLMQLGFAHEGTLHKKGNIIKACCVLHNLAKKFSVPPPPVAGKIEPLHPSRWRTMPVEVNPEALKARQEIIDDTFSSIFSSQDTSNKDTEEDA
ncbi:hypothetical protein PBY51_001610 [Eleginops maclovinus]|uniref:DDE Tnp4 domain-containing protein n=1 Tax=Eleginops maclovinus TaxID=56733 RepID=A0AAN7WWD5_ELEMC|nr:hypothetical protein PBY51_001610 [Eleginops maclovinus]